MRKRFWLYIGILLLWLSGCGGGQDKASQPATLPGKGGGAGQSQTETAASDILDLTKVSGAVVYTEVFSMMQNPASYLGRTIKIKGNFKVYKNETSGQLYFACLVADAAACCSQGLEFELAGGKSYPADYPAEGDAITVQGILDSYEEGAYRYLVLRDAVLDEAGTRP